MKHEIIASVLFGAACAFGGDSVWVDRESGIDGEGRGGEAAPFASIQAAVEAASDGDTVYVRPGIYDNGFRVDAHGNTNRVMVSNKKLRIVATGTRAETHIVGRHCDTTPEGFGPGAVRCVSVRGNGALGTVISGFTIRDGASNNYNPSVDTIRDCAGGVVAAGDGNTYSPTGAYVVDCEIRSCAGVRGGATRGVTAVRCFINGNYASNSGSAGRNSAFVNCLIVRNDGPAFIYDGECRIYSCTVVNNRSRLFSADVRNSVVLNNNYNDGGNFFSGTTLVDSVYDTGEFQFLAPLYDDFRPLEGSVTMSAGDASHLSALDLPDGIDVFRDFAGAAIPQTGTIAAGCIQTPAAAPEGGAVLFPEYNAVRIDGKPVYGAGLYVLADRWPMQVRVQAETEGKMPVRNYELNRTLVYPMMDDSLWVMPPQNPDGVVTCTVSRAGKVLTVDPSAADATDSRDGVEDSVPFKTISKALELAPHYAVVKVAPGEYAEGEGYADASNGKSRVSIEKQVRLVGSGADKTVIRGGEGIRCVDVRLGNVAVQGFTIADGQTDLSTPNLDLVTTRGGGVNTDSIASSRYHTVRVLDCIITNCIAVRGGGVYGTTCERTLITDCYGLKSANRNGRFVSCVFDYHGTQLDGMAGNGSYCGIHVNCTVVGKNVSEYVFNRESGNPQTNTIVHTTAEHRFDDGCAGSLVWNAGSFATASGVVNADPRLAGIADRDYRIIAGSPALGIGEIVADLDINWADFEGRGMNFTGGRPAAGAYQWPVPGAYIATPAKGAVEPAGWCVPGDDGTIEVEFTDAADRHLSGALVNGREVLLGRGETALSVRLDMQNLSTATEIVPIVSTNWYVNANTDSSGGRIVGDDANSGFTPWEPKRTLAAMFASGLVLAGDCVHAAEGVYDDGEDETYKARVTLPPGTALVADAGPEKTFIVGRAAEGASIGERLSEDNLRCVWMCDDTRLCGFTLTGGGTESDVDNVFNHAVSGGAVGCAETAIVSGCIISNNCSSTANCYNGTYVGCRIVGNYAFRRASAAYNALLYSSYVDGNEGNNAMQAMIGLYNCTVGANNTRNGVPHVAIYNHGEPLVNCAFLGWVYGSDVMNAYNCRFLEGKMPATYVTLENCQVFKDVSGFGLDADGRPLSAASPLVDGCTGEYAHAGENYAVDAGGGQRVYNGAMDIGCFEYDWRPRYSAVLGVKVAGASAGVTATDDAVVIPSAGSVTVEWANGYGIPKRSSFTAAVSEGAALEVERDGAPLASFGPGEERFSYKCEGEDDTLVFSCTGAGSAAISDFVRGRGFGIILR